MKSVIFNDYEVYENGDIYNKYGRKVSIRTHDNRYEVTLTVEDKRKSFILGRLIYWLFIEQFNYDNKNLCVSYKDGNSLNIDLINLYLVERKDIIQGEGHRNRCKLSDEQIKEIKNEWNMKTGKNQYDKIGLSLNDLAKKYNVSKSNISMIIKGRSRDKEKYKLK